MVRMFDLRNFCQVYHAIRIVDSISKQEISGWCDKHITSGLNYKIEQIPDGDMWIGFSVSEDLDKFRKKFLTKQYKGHIRFQEFNKPSEFDRIFTFSCSAENSVEAQNKAMEQSEKLVTDNPSLSELVANIDIEIAC